MSRKKSMKMNSSDNLREDIIMMKKIEMNCKRDCIENSRKRRDCFTKMMKKIMQMWRNHIKITLKAMLINTTVLISFNNSKTTINNNKCFHQ
jgi:hypothetical protein